MHVNINWKKTYRRTKILKKKRNNFYHIRIQPAAVIPQSASTEVVDFITLQKIDFGNICPKITTIYIYDLHTSSWRFPGAITNITMNMQFYKQ